MSVLALAARRVIRKKAPCLAILFFMVSAGVAGVLAFGFLRALLGNETLLMVGVLSLVIVGVIIVRNLQTNRKETPATIDQRNEALRFEPVPGKAVLYVFRNQFVGRAVGVNVLIDGHEAAQIKSPRFTRIVLTPGSHRIAGYVGTNKKPTDGEGTELVANAGDIYVAKCEVEPQMVGVRIKFTPMSIDAARADLQKITRMVAADIAEV